MTPNDSRDRRLIEWFRAFRPPSEPKFDTDAGWDRFANAHLQAGRTRRRAWGGGMTPGMWRIAAVITLVAIGTAAWWTRQRHDLVEIVAVNGVSRTVTLGDGSTIILNGGSRVRYARSMGRGARDVELEGEAAFSVTHDANRPFRVHARHGVIEDIGTKFTVRAYPERPTVEVGVFEGSVILSAPSNIAAGLLLHAGEAAVLDSTAIPRRLYGRSLDRYLAWTTGTLVFEKVTLAEAAQELEHAFGAHVVVDDTLLGRRELNARIRKETIQLALDAICVALDATYEQRDSTFVIRRRIPQ